MTRRHLRKQQASLMPVPLDPLPNGNGSLLQAGIWALAVAVVLAVALLSLALVRWLPHR